MHKSFEDIQYKMTIMTHLNVFWPILTSQCQFCHFVIHAIFYIFNFSFRQFLVFSEDGRPIIYRVVLPLRLGPTFWLRWLLRQAFLF
jgi:hypothetical protein